MKNTLQAISNKKFSNILKNIGKSDITYNINFNLFKNIIRKIGGLSNNITTQRNFLIKMGIKHRAEIISEHQSFLTKTDIFYRLDRLINEKKWATSLK